MSENTDLIPNIAQIAEKWIEFRTSMTNQVRLLMKKLAATETEPETRVLADDFYGINRLDTLPGLVIHGNLSGSFPITMFREGDLVRIRSLEEIQATLDRWGQLKGCGFIPGMEIYCGTQQRVFKPLEGSISERDYRERRCSHIYSLQGVMCRGTGPCPKCDRSCLFYWRAEWLEKQVEPVHVQPLADGLPNRAG